jgi:hypothetical protein
LHTIIAEQLWLISLARGITISPEFEKEIFMADHSQMKLGRGRVKTDIRTLKMGK